MTARVILNPYANRWMAKAQQPEAEAALKAAGIDYDLIVTDYPGHGIDIAAQSLREGYNPIIAAGGDSTYSEVVNGLMKAAGDAPIEINFGILPMGTANDLADNLEIPKNLSDAAKIIANGHTRRLDICQVNQRYFVNNSGVGLETAVSVQQTKMTRVHGILRYLLATVITIFRNPQWQMEISWDNGQYSGPVTLVSVGNNPRTGGIFYTVPNANPFDGKLSFVYGYVATRSETFRLLPKIMRADQGNYTEHKNVHEQHCTWLKINTKPDTPVHADGEVFLDSANSIYYRIHPGRIAMLLAPI